MRINVVHAKLTKDVDAFGKQDPYCKLTYMGTPYKTRVHESGGKAPVWNQAFEIRIGSLSDEILVEVKDDDVVGAKHIGQTNLKCSSLAINNGVREYFTLMDKHGQDVGQILFETKYTPDAKPATAQVPVAGTAAYAVPQF